MKRIEIDCSLFTSREETHRVLARELELPDYYGANLDALYDCLTERSEETQVVFVDDGSMKERLGGFADGLFSVFRDSAEENPRLSFSVKSKKKSKFYYRDQDAPIPNNPPRVGVVTLITCGGRLLLERRADSDVWGIVGGALDNGETLREGSVREVFEETGIALSPDRLAFVKLYDDPSLIASYPDGNVIRLVIFVFSAQLDSLPELRLSEESKELRFFTKDELRRLQIPRTHQPIIEDYLS